MLGLAHRMLGSRSDAEDVVQDALALDRLSPLERAAFLLHDVFDRPFSEVAQMLDRSEAACR